MNRFRLADMSFLLGAVMGVLVLGVQWTYAEQETSRSETKRTSLSEIKKTLDEVRGIVEDTNQKVGGLCGGSLNFAPVPDTGLRDCWDENGNPIVCAGTGQDGELQRGVAGPTPRFSDNGDGTVKDNLTGLVWLKDANCFGGPRIWQQALDDANNLAAPQCGLMDGSKAGDWRLPNVRELQSLIDFGKVAPALSSGYPFSGVGRGFYWSSSTHAGSPLDAWGVVLIDGSTFAGAKTLFWYGWPVRGGQKVSSPIKE